MGIAGRMVDLDELVLCCRDEKAREYIREAVACYKSEAFRSAIVAAWIAVVFDILHKLRELDLTGDKNARKHLDDFEKIVAGGESKLKEALDFERGILDVAASDFELLTPNEKLDLARLQEDRNRCAHPSMQAMDTVYEPTAELARSHIRNAVEILLAREPVQGKAALARIWAEIKSEYFPTGTEEAVAHFRSGPLARARDSLVRNLVLSLVKAFVLDENAEGKQMQRAAAALGAVIALHRTRAEGTLSCDLPTILQRVSDDQIIRIISLARSCPPAWAAAGDSARARVCRYLESETLGGSDLLAAVICARGVPDLQDIAKRRTKSLDPDALYKLLMVVDVAKLMDLVPRNINELKNAKSFRTAEKYMETLILPMAPVLSAENLGEILRMAGSNSQIFNAARTPDLLAELFVRTKHTHEQSSAEWLAYFREMEKCHAEDKIDVSYTPLADVLRRAGLLRESEEEKNRT